MTAWRLQRRHTIALQGTVGVSGQIAADVSSGLTWSGDPFPMAITAGSFVDLAPYISDPLNTLANITSNVDLSQYNLSISMTPTPRIVAASNATAQVINGVNLTLVPETVGGGNFATRISGPDVVWYHSFDTAAEVNQFRWSNQHDIPGWGGNDPNSLEFGSEHVSWQSSGGADGGAFIRLSYPSGDPSSTGAGSSYWWRPFNPFTGATNGRGANDPGANGTLTPVAWPASSGSSTTNTWSNATNPGWYMHATHQAQNPGKFQGSDFYVQVRVRRAQTPGAPSSVSEPNITGKSVWFSNTNFTYTVQELVTFGQSVGNGDVVGTQSRHNVYVGQNFDTFPNQPNVTVTVNNNTVNWRYSGGWDTLLYHITPGTNGGSGGNRTRVEVWAQHDPTLFPAESGVYTKIWDVTYTQSFDTSNGASPRPGWNAIVLSAYHNTGSFGTTFHYDYDQIIFSKATIPAPI